MSVPRNHHFVPAFYLRQWCGPDGKLIEYSIKHGKLIPKPVGANSTGFEFDLYAFNELPPEQAQYVEQRFFDYADRTASDALQLHVVGQTKTGWGPELIGAWSRFVIGLHVRHPDAMPELREATKVIWEESGANSQRRYDEIRQPGDPATFDEYLGGRDPLTPVKARVNLIIKGVLDNEIVITRVNGMRWAVLDVSASPLRLLTSDRPVHLFDIKAPRGLISLPISPTKLFLAVNDPRVFERVRNTKPRRIVTEVNKLLVARARRFVWADDQGQKLFVQKHMSTKLEPTPFFPSLSK